MSVKKRKPFVLILYYMAFAIIFLAWLISTINYCAPPAFFYNFTSKAPVSYKSYDDYIGSIQKYEEECDKQYRQRLFWTNFQTNIIKRLIANSGESIICCLGSPVRDYIYCDITNNHVAGVNEGDIIKNDEKYLYILSEHESVILDVYPHVLLEGAVTIVDAYPPGEMRAVSKIGLVSGKSGESRKKYTDIYISGQNLIVLSIEYNYYYYDTYYGYYEQSYSAVTSADIYDITDRSKPVYKRTFQLDGYLVNSREQNGILYLITAKSLRDDNYYNYVQLPEITDQERYVPFYYDTNFGKDEEKQYVPADRLYTCLPKVTKNDYNGNLSTINIAAIDLTGNTPAEVSSYTYTDSYIQLYMSAENNIYLMQYKQESGIYYTDIMKLSVDKTDIQYVASKKVSGSMNNRFSADEYKGNFRIMTTESLGGNHLFILDENLEFISSVRNFAERERIESVRFDGDIGYIATFKNTDLLFVIDLSDAQSPEIIGELKIPGYSTYLHPLGDGLLLGAGDDTATRYWTDENGNETDIEIGFWRTGIKASLFDVSDIYNPKEISALRLGGVSSSIDIEYNHKGFMNIPGYSMFSIRGNFTDIAATERTDDIKNQALLISYNKDDGLKLIQAFDSIDYDNDYYYYADYYNNFPAINRITYIGNIIYHFDGESVNAYDMNVTDENGYLKIGTVYYK